MRSRSWAWLLGRIQGLLNRPHLYAPDGVRTPTTRLAWQLYPPKHDTTNTTGR